MRRAYSNVSWLHNEAGVLAGLSLGYDHCAEHENGSKGIEVALGVRVPEYPLGVDDRAIHEVPEGRLVYAEHKYKPQDKRRKAYPAAYLMLVPRWRMREAAAALPNQPMDVDRDCSRFVGEKTDKWYRSQDDILTAWSSDEFCIHVRGEENIANLKALYEAFLAKDIAMALAWAKGFERGGISFTILSKLDQSTRDSVLATDQAWKKLQLAAQATGIHAVLEAAGKRYFALGPDWADREAQEEVIFFLNPQEQRKYNHGWFTVAELTDWAADRGVVLQYQALNDFEKLPENYDWACRLLRGLQDKGYGLRYHAAVTWADEQKTVPGLRLRFYQKSEKVMADGIYPFAAFMAEFAAPLEVKAAAAA